MRPSLGDRAMDTPDDKRGAEDSVPITTSIINGDPEAAIGEVVDGRYLITAFLGQGGMGAVYAGEHLTIKRPIAVKILHPAMSQIPELVRRFEREAFAIGRIAHPNCVNVSDFGRLKDGSLFLVMEFLDGRELAEVITQEAPLAVDRALRICRHILRGLDHAHGAGIVHRDIKPENIVLVKHDGDRDFAKILDFGIAKLVGEAKQPEDANLTQAGVAFGTPTYMSPEQTLGVPVDARSDIYSVTLLLFEMLTGKPPFRSEDKLEVLAMQASRPPPSVGDIAPGVVVSPTVQAILDKGLEKRAKDRFASAAAYVRAIDYALSEIDGRHERTPPPQFGPPPDLPMVTPSGTVPPNPRHETTAPPEPITGTAAGGGTATLQRRPPKKQLIVAGVAVAILSTIAIFFALRNTSLAPSSADPSKWTSPLAQAAADELERGQPKAALAILHDANKETLAADAEGQLLLGHALAATGNPKSAATAYHQALVLSPDLKDNPALRANLDVWMEDERHFARAAKILVELIGDDSAKEKILALAVAPGSVDWRRLAVSTADDLEIGADLDRRIVYELDLLEGSRCRERVKAVAKLRALGDPKAIPALKTAQSRRGTKGRYRGRNINACLKDDAEAAVQYLESLDTKVP